MRFYQEHWFFSFQKSILKSMSPKRGIFGHFWSFFQVFQFFKSKHAYFMPQKGLFLWYTQIISFKQNRNEVNRTFLALSNNYHASMSPKPNQEPEVCRMQPIYPLKFYIIQAFRNRRISSAENGCGTEGVEQIWTAP